MADEPKIFLTDEQWEWLKEQERRRNEAVNQALREAIGSVSEQTHVLRLQEERHLEEKRDWFAGHALSGMMASERASDDVAYQPDVAADRAYRMANAMMDARSALSSGGEQE